MVLQCMTVEEHETIQAPERGERNGLSFQKTQLKRSETVLPDPYAM